MPSIDFSSIITHPGSSHKDELLACCVLIAKHPVPIIRREPVEEELDSPQVCVVDVGHRHQPELNNFDHHQFPRDHAPTCSLSLVLMSLGLYEDAKQFCDWLETTEWLDCRGPMDTCARLGIERSALAQLNSPIDITLLRRFAAKSELGPNDPLWEVMRMIGEDLISFIENLRQKLEHIAANAILWEFPFDGKLFKILFIPRTEAMTDDPSMGIGRYIDSLDPAGNIVGTVCPDRRGNGYGLSRYNDYKGLDFTLISEQKDVHFAHARGFVAKTTATESDRLKQLIAQSFTPVLSK